jgi:hypothetical protein
MNAPEPDTAVEVMPVAYVTVSVADSVLGVVAGPMLSVQLPPLNINDPVVPPTGVGIQEPPAMLNGEAEVVGIATNVPVKVNGYVVVFDTVITLPISCEVRLGRYPVPPSGKDETVKFTGEPPLVALTVMVADWARRAVGVNATLMRQLLGVPVPVTKAVVDAHVVPVAAENIDADVPEKLTVTPSRGMPEFALFTVTA